MKPIRNRRGYTVIEVLVVAGIMALVSAGCMSMLVASMGSFEGTTVQSYSDSDAVIAMQRIVTDIREAKSFNIIANGERLRLIFPKTSPEGYYNRREADMGHQIDYYLSDSMGVPGHDGTLLWRGKNDGDRRRVADNISGLSFETDTTRSLKITVVSSNDTADGAKTTSLTERVVYLRNY